MEELNIVEARIQDLQAALSSKAITSVDLVAQYLRRISTYDCRGLMLNSIPLINLNVFDEAAASDDRRAFGAPIGLLEGIPFTAKDSYKVKGMTVASGSPAFKNLIASDDAFTVAAIRAAGAVLIGKTNMPSMAYGGMQRGIYGRAESPYNPRFLAAAFASGSSNGSGVSTAASLASFGMGEETVSSGRSPASNNSLVAYTPSRGWISIRGNWPLYPTCDVVVPHTRSMQDMLTLLEVISAEDPISEGDFWRDQPFITLTKPWPDGPKSIRDIPTSASLNGVRIAVPDMYVAGRVPPGAVPVITSEEVNELWVQARCELESLGAEVIIVPDFPVVTAYENPALSPDGSPQRPDNWHQTERGPLIAHGWNDFLRGNKDPKIATLADIDVHDIYPDSMRTSAEMQQLDPKNAIHWDKLTSHVKGSSIWDIPDLELALHALEGMRKALLDDYLASYECHCFAFPAAGDVGAANADVDDESAAYAWHNGVLYSNGNKALRHLGVPTVTVPMGLMSSKKMPVGLTFAGPANSDLDLLKYAYAFDRKAHMRVRPPTTPPLVSDRISLLQPSISSRRALRPQLTIKSCTAVPTSGENGHHMFRVSIEGFISPSINGFLEIPYSVGNITITVDSLDVPPNQVKLETTSSDQNGSPLIAFSAWILTNRPPERDTRVRTIAPVALEKIMVVITARSALWGYPCGWLGLIEGHQ